MPAEYEQSAHPSGSFLLRFKQKFSTAVSSYIPIKYRVRLRACFRLSVPQLTHWGAEFPLFSLSIRSCQSCRLFHLFVSFHFI